VEARDDVGRLEHDPHVRAYEQPGVVIDAVQDLDVGAVGEHPVGDVGLPALVRHLSFEPHERAPRTLVGLRGDQATSRQHPPDRRGSRCATVTPLEVDGDRVGAGIVTLLRQVLAELHDLLLDRLGDLMWARPRTSRPRLEPGLALNLETSDELVYPPSRDAVVPSDGRLAPPLDQDRRDDQPCQRHLPPP
jgi:hypothetical protein